MSLLLRAIYLWNFCHFKMSPQQPRASSLLISRAIFPSHLFHFSSLWWSLSYVRHSFFIKNLKLKLIFILPHFHFVSCVLICVCAWKMLTYVSHAYFFWICFIIIVYCFNSFKLCSEALTTTMPTANRNVLALEITTEAAAVAADLLKCHKTKIDGRQIYSCCGIALISHCSLPLPFTQFPLEFFQLIKSSKRVEFSNKSP